MSVDLETNDKPGRAALGCGGAMFVVFSIIAVILWVLPTATRGDVSGERLGLPFSGVGAIALAGAGLFIGGVGFMMLRRGRRGRAPVPPLPRRPDSHGHVPMRGR